MEVVHHRLVALTAFLVLILENRRSRPAVSGEEQKQVVFEVVDRFGTDLERAGVDVAIREKLKARQPSIRGDILVLLSDRLMEPVDFDLAGLLGKALWMNDVFAIGVQRLEQGGREAAGRSQPGARGDVGHAGDFQVRLLDPHHPQRLAHDRVLHVVHARGLLQPGVFDYQPRLKSLVKRDIHILVDGGGDEESAMLAVIRWQVGPAAAERDAQWTAGYNHRRTCHRSGLARREGYPGRQCYRATILVRVPES